MLRFLLSVVIILLKEKINILWKIHGKSTDWGELQPWFECKSEWKYWWWYWKVALFFENVVHKIHQYVFEWYFFEKIYVPPRASFSFIQKLKVLNAWATYDYINRCWLGSTFQKIEMAWKGQPYLALLSYIVHFIPWSLVLLAS